MKLIHKQNIMGTTNIKDLLENWDQFDELDTEKIIREYTNNYNNPFAIKAVIKYFKNSKNGLELDIKNFQIKDETTGKSSVWSLNYDKLGDVEFFINDKEYDEEYSLSALKKIMSKNQLGELIDELEKKLITPQQPENAKFVEVYKTRNLFKVGLLFATGEMNKYFTVNSKNITVMNEGFSAPKIAKELNNEGYNKYILASINNYTDKENGKKNIFNSFDMMTKIISYCEAENKTVDTYFKSRLPID